MARGAAARVFFFFCVLGLHACCVGQSDWYSQNRNSNTTSVKTSMKWLCQETAVSESNRCQSAIEARASNVDPRPIRTCS